MSGTRGQGARRRRTARRQRDQQVQQRAVRRRGNAGVTDTLVAAASGSTSLTLGPRDQKWDAAAADKSVRAWAGAEDAPNARYAQAFMVKQGDGTKFGDYKLGFAQPDGGTLKANWGGVTAVAGVLSGARGGANITPEETASAKAKCEAYYTKARTAYNDDTITVPWAKKAASVGEQAEALAYAEYGGDLADDGLIALATLAWIDRFENGSVVWNPEDGLMDLMGDLTNALNLGDSDRWYVADVSIGGDRAILCDCVENQYWLAPLAVGPDGEPVLALQAEWTPVEAAWVESSDEAAKARAKAMLGIGREMPPATRDIVAVEDPAVFAAAVCADCGHPAEAHTNGPCSADGCYCNRFVESSVPTHSDAHAARAACANCDHAYTAHLGTEGPCAMDGCGCDGYQGAGGAASNTLTVADLVRLGEQGWKFNPIVAASSGGETTFTLTFDQAVALPDEHQPGARIPERNASPAPPAPTSGAEWSAILAPEGRLTSDGRAFAPGSITWRDLPLTLMAMVETSEGGHVGAEIAGRIDKIWRDDSSGLIRASGVWDSREYGQQIAGLVEDETLRGVSVDLAIQRYDVGPRSDWFDDDGNWSPKDEASRDDRSIIDIVYSDEPDVAVVLEAEIGMVTVCPFPAFSEARIVTGDSLVAHGGAATALWTVTQAGFAAGTDPQGSLTASASAADAADIDADTVPRMAPQQPPAAWFHVPEADHPAPLTVTDDGQVYGHAALWASCHIGFPGRCQPPPESHTHYAYFHLGEVTCDDGSREAVGTITLDTGHAPNGISRAETVRHYDDTGTVVAYVKARDGAHGIWVSGVLRSDAPVEKVNLLRGAKLSGDWRKVDGNLEMVALLTVNVPGFPVPRHRAEYVNGEIESLVAAGIPLYEQDIDAADMERFRALAAEAEFAMLALADRET